MSAAPELAARLFTERDLERLTAQGHRYELVRGELRAMAPAGGEHGRTGKRLDHALTSHIYEYDLGECFLAETGFTIARNPDTTLAPDWAFVARARMPDPLPEGFVPVAPDIVLETRSPGDSTREVADKIALWLQAGVRVALDLDPVRRRLTVYGPGAAPQVFGVTDVLTLEDVLPGFSAPVERLFTEGGK